MATSMFTKAPRAGRMQRMSGAPRCRASVTAIVAARATSSRPVDRVAPATRLPRAAALALALVSSACSGPGPHQAPGPGSISPPFDPTELPQPPRPISLTGRDPTAVAAELVAATADALPDVSPGWLAAYAAFGVPVTDSRTGQRPADPVGPRWAQVWSVGQTSRGKVRVPLADVARSLAGGFGDPVSGDVVLADLRAGATSGNAATQTLARFVAAKSLAAGGTDPLDPVATPQDVAVDAATLQLLGWVALRHALVASATAAQVAEASPAADPGVGSGKPCAEAFGSGDQNAWLNWVINQFSAGAGIGWGGPDLPGTVQVIVKRFGGGEKLLENVGHAVNIANGVAAIASLIAEVAALRIEVSLNGQDPLVRNKERSDGAKQTLNIYLTYDVGDLNIDTPVRCALLFVANAFGVGLSLPSDGVKVSGAEVLANPGTNMPDKIYFAGPEDLKFSTDEGGKGSLIVLGHARAKELPDSARKQQREFGIIFSAQVEEAGLLSIVNTFVDGLGAASGLGGIGSALSGLGDVLKTMHYDLGEQFVPYVDWEEPSYTAVGGAGGVTITGQVPSITQPFTLDVTGPGSTGTVVITPSGSDGLSGTVAGTSTQSGLVLSTTGSYTATRTPTGYQMTATVQTCIVSTGSCSDAAPVPITLTANEP